MNTSINDSVFETFPELESERLIYREFELRDAQDLYLIRSDDRVMTYMDTVRHSSILDSEALIRDVRTSFLNKKGINWAVVEKSTDEFMGYFGYWRLIPDHCRAEIGFALKPAFWGRGYMKETILALVDFGFSELKLHSIEANVNPGNESSRRLLEKLGFVREAHFRENYLFDNRFIDSVIYSLLETDKRGVETDKRGVETDKRGVEIFRQY